MFQIRPAVPEDYYEIKDCLERHGKELQLSPQMGIMTAIEHGVFAGLGLYRLEEDEGELLEIITVDEQDEELAFFIGKAVLNKLDLSGTKEVTCFNGELDELLKKLEFYRDDEGVRRLCLKDYFVTPCQRRKRG